MLGVRRAFAILVLAGILTIPAVALASSQDANDGTLSVRNGVGRVWIGARGVVIGRFDSGSVRIVDPAADGETPSVQVWGAERHREPSDTTDVWSGTNVRFRIVGRVRITVTGSDIDLSAIGTGRVGLHGNDTNGPDGTFWINDGPTRSLPNPIVDDPYDFSDFYTFYDLSSG
jgi:hypothetical protein